MQFEPLNAEAIEKAGLGAFIDHTLLRPDARFDEVEKICAEALQFGFAGVCVNSLFMPIVSSLLQGSQTKPVCVVGFPLGATLPLALARETRVAIGAGAREIDMVLPIGLLKSGKAGAVHDTIHAVVDEAASRAQVPVKVIIETFLLTDDEKKLACEISARAKAAYVKTCTGFSGGGATVEDVRLMKSVVGNDLGVKASGGIKSTESARALLLAGAHRLGTSSGVALVTAKPVGTGY